MRAVLDRLRDARDYARAASDNALGLFPEILAQAKQPLHAALYDLVENRLDPLIAAIDRLIGLVEAGEP